MERAKTYSRVCHFLTNVVITTCCIYIYIYNITRNIIRPCRSKCVIIIHAGSRQHRLQKRAAHLYQLADDGCISNARALRTESDAVGAGNRTALHDSV